MGSRTSFRSGVPVAVLLLCSTALLIATSATAQDYLGPNRCINCHDHDDEKEWWEREDGPPPNGHINALRQMENVDSSTYAGAVGLDASLDGVYDLEGSCVTCHATVFKGDANAGISCESCHGPGSDYLDSHQEENSYQDSLTKGMLDTIGNIRGWVDQCVRCHIMEDQRLIDAGHPSGDDFVLEEKFATVAVHWSNDYQVGEVAAGGAAVRDAILAAREAPPSAPALATATALTGLTPAPAPVAPPVATTATAPQPTLAEPMPATAPTSAPDLTPAREAAPAPVPDAAPERDRGRPVAPPPAPPPPRQPTPPTSPAPTPRVVISETEANVVTPPPELPRSPAALVAAIQGRAVALLDRLLRREGRAPVRVTPPEPLTEYRGADAELLRLQQEVLALALEALGTAPADREPASPPDP